ncbi:putative ABC transporter [Aspergillus campestris IBT 28561]|uniref:ABC transporter n=1 Tax=Aspergillus campestris (strain IBT 28561) TaxID=1392248 RepID=A0A2I1DGR3_ASPC2|nr:putative ABC transporter [Aspergillus campestris IBT 28561]PKY09063.1 putative ABC transporter [Aspergillus campestris IBT 28561]
MASVSTPPTGACGDSQFGAIVSTADCRGGFDFTVAFESGILNILPAACFLLPATFRLFRLSRQAPKVFSSAYRVITLVSILTSIWRRILLASAILDLISALVVIVLVDMEHFRSIRPSFLASAYLFVTLLLDLARVRTSWLLAGYQGYPACLSASLAVKLLLLILTNTEKRKWFLHTEKDHSTESVSGPFSRGLFTWLNGLLWKGHSVLLTGDALPTVHRKLLSSELSTRFADSWTRHPQKGQNALLVAVIKCLRWEIATIALPRLCVVGFSIAQPFLIGRVVTVLQQTSPLSQEMGYALIAATAIVFTGIAVSRASYEHLGYRATTMLRGGLMALVFQHMMDLPLGSNDESSAMALLGADIEMVAEYFYSVVCETWANVLQLTLATWLLQTQVGVVCIAPILVVIIFTGFSFAMGNAVSARQKSWLQATEKRINFTTSILGSIRNVKVLGLTEVMSSMVEGLRTEELEISKKFRKLQSIRVCMVNSPMIVGQLVTLAAYAILALLQGSGGLAVGKTIMSLSLISLMITPLSYLLMAIPDTYASIGCLNRIQDFLMNPSRLDRRQLSQPVSSHPTPTDSIAGIELCPLLKSSQTQKEVVLSLQNVRFGWKSPSSSETLGITLELESSPTGTVIILVGPVGCGKSTVLKGLAGETPVLEGELFIKYPDLAFCDETPWLSNASIQKNIAGEDLSTFDPDWYHTVVRACALDVDLKRMPAGDKTSVGSKGSKLSGGQRQRIAIARAVYARRRIACFDDVLSGLDNATARHVFDNVFGPAGLLRRLGCTVFLSTHTIHHLPQADLIMVLGENGQVIKQCSYTELRDHAHNLTERHGIKLTPTAKTEQIDDLENPSNDTTESISAPSPGVHRQTTDLAVYKYYFSALGWFRIAALLLFLMTDAGINAFRYVWVDLWSSSSDNATASRLGYWLGLYGAFSVIQALSLALAVFWTWVIIVPAASKNLHSVVLHACMGAPLSFLSKVDTGVLVTRFSQDMRLVDMILPRGFISTGFLFFGAIAQGATAIASLPYLAAALPLLLGVLVLIQRFYLRTSRQLRLLEIELKSPLYTHFIESLSGLITIRAFSWTQAATSRMISKLDTAQRPYYLLLCIQRWLSLVLNLIVAATTVLLVGIAFALRTRVDAGLLGIALVMMMDLGLVLSELIQNWTLLETSLGAVSRIKEFAEGTCREESNAVVQAQSEVPEWLTEGEVAFVSASVSWTLSETKPLLNGINLRIPAGKKFGLCGRTGSGKSTLALSLLRLNEITSGQILIDGQDISLLSRSSIRQHISCLSQEPFLFPGTVRQNADPLNAVSSARIIDALQSVGVWDSVAAGCGSDSTEEEEKILDSILDNSILSQGQKQLFCLARALLKRSKILILDEPTSSLDPEADTKVQRVIRESFPNCTVIMVAHRIRSLLDFDQVAVLDSGRVIEVGSPRELLRKADGEFARLFGLES